MISPNLEKSLQNAFNIANDLSHEYVTLEHLLLALTEDDDIIAILTSCSISLPNLRKKILNFLKDKNVFIYHNSYEKKVKLTIGVQRIIQRAQAHANIAGIAQINSINILLEFFSEHESHSLFFLLENNLSIIELVPYITKKSQLFKQYNEISGTDTIKANTDINALEEYCVNLNDLALKGDIDKLVKRENEVSRTINILLRRTKNNPIYVGDPGVGKTAIVEGLAYKIVNGEVPIKLKNMQIYSLKVGSLLAGTRYRGDFEERIKLILNEISHNKNIILFIDEIHTIVGAGATSSGSVDAGNLLKPFLTKGPLRCIGATTYKEYFTYFEKDAALARRFQRIDIKEPNLNDTIQILHGIKPYYEDFHNVRYTHSAIKEIVSLTDRYVSNKVFPDKAIDVMDEIGAHYNTNNNNKNKTIIASHQNIGVKNVRSIFSKLTKISLEQLNYNVDTKMTNLAKKLKLELFGQDEIIDKIINDLRIGFLGLKNEGKPIGNYLFTGTTGVGKTELAKKIAENLSMQFIRLDMSEFMESHSISKLIGSPPGYVGYDKVSEITDKLSRDQHSLILFDEIEKAHHNVHNILLQIIDYGYLTDSTGRKIKFNNAIIVLTANVKADNLNAGNVGFIQQEANNNIETKFIKFFSSELLNRMDLILSFNLLSEAAIQKVVHKVILTLRYSLSKQGINLQINEKVIDKLVGKNLRKNMSARGIEKSIRDDIISIISQKRLKARVKNLKLVLDKSEIKCCA
jgi:ATP-dependent Clp protease ATP-binding subunit ClpA